MTHEKPDLSQIPPQIRDYIEALEAEIERLRPTRSRRSPARFDDGELDNLDLSELLEPAEEQTTINVITATGNGFAKRTPTPSLQPAETRWNGCLRPGHKRR